MSNKNHTATFYVQLEPEFGYYVDSQTGERSILGAKAVGITQKKPAKPRAGTVVVKLDVRVPEAAFLPLRPEAVVTIPESLTQPHPIEVVAGDPNQE